MARFPRPRFVWALSSLPQMAAFGIAAFLIAQSDGREPDRRASVAGWTVEDVAEPGDFEPDRRVVRMIREAGNTRVAYEVYPDSEASAGGFDAQTQGGCFSIHGLDVEAEGPGRASAVRAALANALEGHKQVCAEGGFEVPDMLGGFEAAFARLSEWRDFRVAESAALYETYLMQNEAEMEDLNALACEAPDC